MEQKEDDRVHNDDQEIEQAGVAQAIVNSKSAADDAGQCLTDNSTKIQAAHVQWIKRSLLPIGHKVSGADGQWHKANMAEERTNQFQEEQVARGIHVQVFIYKQKIDGQEKDCNDLRQHD